MGLLPARRMEFGYKRRPLRVEWAKVGLQGWATHIQRAVLS